MNNTRTFECKTASKKSFCFINGANFWASSLGSIVASTKDGGALPRRFDGSNVAPVIAGA
jgi:hypothetical protein